MQESFTERVAGNVRAEMARNGETQVSLSRKLGTSQTSLSRRISGRVPFSVAELEAVARELGIATSRLTDSGIAEASA